MEPFWNKNFGNPMAQHLFGEEARETVESARGKIADFFSFDHDEIIFTSGATESNNLAVKGTINAVKKQVSSFIPHVITTAYEHHCLLDSVRCLEKAGDAEVTYIKPNREGVISPKDIGEAIKPSTVLVSVMYVNNEIGTINPLEKIGKLVKKERERREEKAREGALRPPRRVQDGKALPLYFHSDAVQGVNYLPCDMRKLGLDLFSFSGHKIYGPKGVGGLGVKKGIFIEKVQHGGEQEFNLRAGTHNVPGIAGLAKAIRQIGQNNKIGQIRRIKKIQGLRDYFWRKLRKEIKDIQLNGSLKKRVPNNLNVSFAGVEGESMVLLLSQAGVACSTGSACSSASLEPSHVLLSIGCSHPEAHSSLRFTLGEGTTRSDIDYATLKIGEAAAKLRKIAGL
jgi:cysteine desulfurase